MRESYGYTVRWRFGTVSGYHSSRYPTLAAAKDAAEQEVARGICDCIWITEEFLPPGWVERSTLVCEVPENEAGRRNRRARALREYQSARDRALALGLEL